MVSMPNSPRFRIRLFFGFIVFLYLCIVARVVYTNSARGAELLDRMFRQTRRIINLPGMRGDVLDKNGVKLAMDIPCYLIIAEPLKVKDVRKASSKLSRILGLSQGDLLQVLRSKKSEECLKGCVSKQAADMVEALKLSGVVVRTESMREYPQRESAASVVGVKGKDGGLEGIEKVYESWLVGRPGFILLEKDAIGRNVPKSVKMRVPSEEGNDVYLTIDMTIQHYAESELKKALEQYQGTGGTAVVMEPSTGRVLAMASEPGFDPNNFKKINRNHAVSLVYEPGSTLKGVLAAAAIDTAEGNKYTRQIHCSGTLHVGRRTIEDAHSPRGGHGWLSLSEIIEYSCNISAAQVGMGLGSKVMQEYVKRFHLGEKFDIELNGEERGLLPASGEWKPLTLATVSFGQGISVTPLQLAVAFAAIANDGVMMQPTVVEKIVSADGETVYQFTPHRIRRVISTKSAIVLKQMLKKVVDTGTGGRAKIENYSVAGKTGTAQVPVNGVYVPGKYISSFIGFAPVEKPAVLVFVLIEEPHGEYYGGVVAAPAFREITRRSLWYLKVPPTTQPSATVAKF